ncbi:hypothetical protein P8625_11470 [Tenacibaculum tangerinum]|uniref:Uncharacterized protein n=1 Tax=Tenacibaculum tangerinum TaxID=3038772 RepID=A0ABY8L3V7_9FLAO|nr:hypothetical protein [Tenacibaculum tangerinum]WGH74699.1 hypothetical protein P8625_11470 [Tenacibaculum tangerinum]
MIDLSRLPDQNPDEYKDADIDEAVSDIKDWNKDITPEEERFRGETKLRENLAVTFTIIIASWLLSVLLLLVGNENYYKLSDGVLKTLLITTTANVIGMMTIILRNLFPKRDTTKQ